MASAFQKPLKFLVRTPAFLMVWGCTSVYRMEDLQIWKGTSMLKDIYSFWRSICFHLDYIFFKEKYYTAYCYYENIMVSP